MATNVNLDALIRRSDFDIVESTSQSAPPQTMQIRGLENDAFFYSGLRKPDFQRETASWSPRKIRDFVKTFVEGDLIPAIILWRSQGSTFIIDGAHRLSASARAIIRAGTGHKYWSKPLPALLHPERSES